MSRRFRGSESQRIDDTDVPYGPPREPSTSRRRRSDEPRQRPSSCSSAITAYAIFGGADFGAGFWDLVAGGARRGQRPRDVIDHSIGPVWEANHVWLIFSFVVLWTCFPDRLRVDHPHAVRPTHARRARHRVPRVPVSRSARRCSGPATGATSVPRSPCRRCWCRTAWEPSPAASPPDECPPAAQRGPVEQLAEPHLDHRRAARGQHGGLPRGGVRHLGRTPSRRRGHGRLLPRPCPRGRGGRRCRRRGRDLRAAPGCDVPLRRAHVAGAAARRRLGGLRASPRSCCSATGHTGAPASQRWRRWPASWSLGAWRSGTTSCRRP